MYGFELRFQKQTPFFKIPDDVSHEISWYFMDYFLQASPLAICTIENIRISNANLSRF